MIKHGNKVYRINFRHQNEVMLTMDFSKLHHKYNFLLILPQAMTEMLLLETLEENGISVQYEHAFMECRQKEDSLRIIVESKDMRQVERFDYCIGADGAHSAVRKDQEFEFKGKPYEDDWHLVDLQMEWPYSTNEANTFLHDDGTILFVAPFGGKHYRLVANTKSALAYLPIGAEIEKIMWQSNFKVQRAMVETFQKGNVLLAGDAAHVHSPVGGRGMNLGIEDAFALSDAFSTGKLDEYSSARSKAAERVLADTDRLFRMAAAKNPVMRYMRDHIVFNMLSNSLISNRVLSRMAGL